ncbi:LOW QUALITY PROTEIN: uncharacterized protein [Anoplolepis gracilipes]|uniref:LOW QUALITY PROTEIN: uncharacterized protein n=1 Tax=Anoplolepis gracilipes TaxID=354296 RepID=UPI003BA01634
MPKDIRYLSKRRRNHLINHDLHNNKNSISLEPANININSDKTFCTNSISFENINQSKELSELSELSEELESQFESNEECTDSQNNLPTLTDISRCNNEQSLREDLRKLIIERNICHNTANELLKILKKHVELPSDVRVLLSTSRNISANIKCISNGRYVHFGLIFTLKRSIEIYSSFIQTDEIKININIYIDGLPISKSSGSQFWPIMASIENIHIYTLPFVIGIYHGMHKPSDANEFLSSFVNKPFLEKNINKFIFFSKNGLIVCNKKYKVRINAILCDAPAKSFITFTKGHTGYFSCFKCVQEGARVNNRVIFPEINSTLRTDDSFKNKTQIEHHTGDSILEDLSIGMISQIPLDYMHLVCLGVIKRLLQLWIRGNKQNRLNAENINSISEYLMYIKHCIPSEFAKKPRTLDEIDKWKATELCQFLLYTGIVILKSAIPPIFYNHFLSLSIAIRIMADPQICTTFLTYAHSLLLWFVSNYGTIYGKEYLSHNVHNLIHIANDVKTFGYLDNFSCFKYENNMQKIKNKIHQCGKPLEKVSNRIFEELQQPIKQYPILHYPIVVHKNKKISYVQYENFKIATTENDKCALLNDNSVIFILDVVEEKSTLFFRVKRFLNPKSLFTVPCASEKLDIYLILNTTISEIITVSLTDIKKKCLLLKYMNQADSYVTIPLLHTNN